MEKTYYPLDERTARQAHEMMSFDEWKSEEPMYREAVDDAWDLAEAAARRDPGSADRAYGLADRYARKYAEWLNGKYRIGAMCPSWLVAGASNFPVRRKERQNEAMERHYREVEGIEAIKDRIRRIGDPNAPIRADDADAISKLEARVAKLETDHERMKAENARARKAGEPAPFPSAYLSSSRAAIKTARKRLDDLRTTKDRGPSSRETEIMGEPVRVVEDVDDMRIRLVFDGRPDDDLRAALKRNGFHWSPRNCAWQRQLTDNARRTVRQLESR